MKFSRRAIVRDFNGRALTDVVEALLDHVLLNRAIALAALAVALFALFR